MNEYGPNSKSLELLSKAAGGDLDALDMLLRQFGPQVRGSLTGRVPASLRGVLSEDDVMQVTYLEAYLGVQKGQLQAAGIDAFVGWLRQIAQDNLRDALKGLGRSKRPPAHRRIVPRAEHESLEALVDVLDCDSATPSRDAARAEITERLQEGVCKLPREHASVVRLYDLEGRPAAEVAEALGRSEGAMYMLRARAHDRLREYLGSSSKFFSRSA